MFELDQFVQAFFVFFVDYTVGHITDQREMFDGQNLGDIEFLRSSVLCNVKDVFFNKPKFFLAIYKMLLKGFMILMLHLC